MLKKNKDYNKVRNIEKKCSIVYENEDVYLTKNNKYVSFKQ